MQQRQQLDGAVTENNTVSSTFLASKAGAALDQSSGDDATGSAAEVPAGAHRVSDTPAAQHDDVATPTTSENNADIVACPGEHPACIEIRSLQVRTRDCWLLKCCSQFKVSCQTHCGLAITSIVAGFPLLLLRSCVEGGMRRASVVIEPCLLISSTLCA